MQYSARRTSLSNRQAHNLARLLKRRRHERGLSIHQLVELTGVNTATISRLENGDILAPQPDTLRALGQPLGLSSYELFTVCEWISNDDLPPLGAYLRVKYRDLALSEADVTKLANPLYRLGHRPNAGPKDREDEQAERWGRGDSSL